MGNKASRKTDDYNRKTSSNMLHNQTVNSKSNLSTFDKLKGILENEWRDPDRSFDEVYTNLLLGDEYIAKDVELLRRLKVSHVLNASQGEDTDRYVDTNEEYYKNLNYPCNFLGIPAMDVTAFQIHPYFDAATQFINDGLKNGKVLVHCKQGISRSATLIIAFLMITEKMNVIEAAKLVRVQRYICPNEGFILQLCDLDAKLSQ